MNESMNDIDRDTYEEYPSPSGPVARDEDDKKHLELVARLAEDATFPNNDTTATDNAEESIQSSKESKGMEKPTNLGRNFGRHFQI